MQATGSKASSRRGSGAKCGVSWAQYQSLARCLVRKLSARLIGGRQAKLPNSSAWAPRQVSHTVLSLIRDIQDPSL